MTTPPQSLIHTPRSMGERIVLLIDTAHKIYEMLPKVDVETLSVWINSGISLFSQERLPTLKQVTDEAERVLLARAMELHRGNITYMASSLGTSRRTIRGRLKRAGMYVGAEDAWVQPGPLEESDAPREDGAETKPGEGGLAQTVNDGVPVEILPDGDDDDETHTTRVGEHDE